MDVPKACHDRHVQRSKQDSGPFASGGSGDGPELRKTLLVRNAVRVRGVNNTSADALARHANSSESLIRMVAVKVSPPGQVNE